MKGPSMQFNRGNKKKICGSHMNANVKENPIQMYSKIRASSHYDIMSFFSLPYQISSD